VGLGCAWWTVSPVGGAVNLSVHADGSVLVQTGATEIGTGAVDTGLRLIVADGLGISPDLVHLSAGATDSGPYDHGSQGSRTLYGVGSAAGRAVEQVRDLIAEQFARNLEAAVADVELAEGQVRIAGDAASAVPISEVIGTIIGSGGPLAVTGRFQPTGPPFDPGCVSGWVSALNEPTFHCQVADVVIDVETGLATVRRIRAIHDTGKVVNPRGAASQVEGGVLQGVGYALSEEILADADGRTLNGNLHDYRVPTIADLPGRVEVQFISDFSAGQGYGGLKGVGEAPVIPTAAAIGSAIRVALGGQPADLPLDRERIARLCDDLGLTDIGQGRP
jgi:CO/xanthine dehydrogenase Mo-binding subunit